MIVVSNTSPITNLAAVGRLDLLQQLYGKVLIPQAVCDEMWIGQPGAKEIQSLSWIEIKQVINRPLVNALSLELNKGEAEVIALGIELGVDLLLLDERKGRVLASRLGLKFIGLLGLLLEAKHKRFIPIVKPVLDDLIIKAGFWVSNQLYTCILQTAGE